MTTLTIVHHFDFPLYISHDDVMIWQRSPHEWPFVRGNHRSSVDSIQKGSVIRIVDIFIVERLNKLLHKRRSAGDLRHYGAHVSSLWYMFNKSIDFQQHLGTMNCALLDRKCLKGLPINLSENYHILTWHQKELNQIDWKDC